MILRENKKRYNIFKKILLNKVQFREQIKNTTPNYDTIIFFEKNKEKIKKIIKIINNNNFSTKNLPDAIKWHCSYYWKHIFKESDINLMKPTLRLLNKSIAIPILLKKDIKDYEKLAKEIAKIYS